MDMMEMRFRMMAAMGGGNVAQAKSGTFTGDGTINVDLNIGFEPDVILIDSGLNFDVASEQGLLAVYIAKGLFTFNYYHNSATDTNARTYNDKIRSTQDQWGASAGAYRNYASYSNGVLSITNKTNHANVCFINNQTYTWTAYKMN